MRQDLYQIAPLNWEGRPRLYNEQIWEAKTPFGCYAIAFFGDEWKWNQGFANEPFRTCESREKAQEECWKDWEGRMKQALIKF